MSFIPRIIFYGGAVFDLARVLIFIALILILGHFFIGTIFIVSGESMMPTLKSGQLVWSNKIAFLTANPSRGDSVVVLYPGDPTNKKYVKRIIGMPGEMLTLKQGHVYINSTTEPLREPYLSTDVISEPDGQWKIKDNEYFLMGDNRPNSNDSRYFGAAEKRFLYGKVSFIIYPDFKTVY